jgi:hypothetical protein
MTSTTTTMSSLVVPSPGSKNLIVDHWILGPPPAGGGVPLEAVAKRRRGCLVLVRPVIRGAGCLIEIWGLSGAVVLNKLSSLRNVRAFKDSRRGIRSRSARC